MSQPTPPQAPPLTSDPQPTKPHATSPSPTTEEPDNDAPNNKNKNAEQLPAVQAAQLRVPNPPPTRTPGPFSRHFQSVLEANEERNKKLQLLPRLAWKHGLVNGHLSAIFADLHQEMQAWRRERRQQGQVQVQGQAQGGEGKEHKGVGSMGEDLGKGGVDKAEVPKKKGPGNPAEAGDGVVVAVAQPPQEGEIALGLAFMGLVVIFMDLTLLLAAQEAQKGATPSAEDDDWLADKMVDWSSWLAIFVVFRCLSRLGESWLNGGFQRVRRVGPVTVVGLLLACVCGLVASIAAPRGTFNVGDAKLSKGLSYVMVRNISLGLAARWVG